MSARSILERDITTIRDDILRFSSLVMQAIDRALEAFQSHEEEFAQTVVNEDDVMDELHEKIEEHVLKTFALQQPMARDLRMLIADLLISNELERMADHAAGIAKTAIRYSGHAPIEVPSTIDRMHQQVKAMLDVVMDAYVEMDGQKAREAARMDDEVDVEYQKLFESVITRMTSGELSIEEGTYLLWAGHNLERIGDRVTNISERIVYAKSGGVHDLNPKPHEREAGEEES
ncbi:MAG TPA: phosphate signaling complex protein PhoU [Aggregatilineales bacterium]|nr:phosphate signaling complex protein PhoU [Chloroflexota bacterium]HOA24285.1 phosphate signaling complex protein PhoU [Aggregatilineales bacterium]HPV08641.1 phosphate signaling complex protein PhoU [Aggregatilineales bacterium]HQA69212.1 phosphate signaling complex protein PhoU [Aggregatilineales bacterium]HQE19771.1 phosphate signaling complex protein PhoU [Aggregatilineales bacterium]